PSRPSKPSEDPPRRGITRKRAASINTEEANRPKIENLSLSTPPTASSRPFDGGSDLICLCTPAPKVPRPRNAFILYRQHHQAHVVQQNPGLANPEISKIIGEQWRLEPEERKSQWKLLAEEEKQRHQRTYPDYRYQPRRANKTGNPQSTRPAPARGQDPHHCPNCGGRYIATPRTPSTPFMTPTTTKPGSAPYGPPPLSQHPGLASRADMNRYGRTHPLWGSSQPPGSLYDIQKDYDRAMSPNESKRRRYNAAGSYHNFHVLPSPPPPYPQPGYPASSPPPHPRQSSFSNPPTPASFAPGPGPTPLSGPSSMLPPRSSPGPMPPPPRPSHSVPVAVPVTGQQYPAAVPHSFSRNNNSEFDESLRLPPLQTHLPASPDTSESSTGGAAAAATAGVTGLGILHSTPTIPSDAAARSVEAMVMSISFVNKLRVLERISPPLGMESGGFSGPRGPVIAIEGPDQRLVRAVAGVVERALRAASPAAEGGWEVRCWEDGSASGGGGANIATSPSSGSTHASINPFTAYLRTITHWHAKSAEIVQFATPRPSTSTRRHPLPSHPISPTTSTPTTATTTVETQPQTQIQGQDNNKKKPLPIALLPSGFSLSLSDRFACAVPIADAYAPVDHWQWMATLWRGIVGADLVVYVSPRMGHGHGHGYGDSVTEGSVVGGGTVEIKSAGLIVARVPVPGSWYGRGDRDIMTVDEKMRRRLGFEVVEWVRG
ncbi:hypothetical protein N657DRAFT_539986, partial [Parathielavia appendiculata]